MSHRNDDDEVHSSFLVNSVLCSSAAFASSPPESAVGPVPGVWCVWSDGSSELRFCPRADSLTLTVREPLGSCPEEAIMVLRDRLGDQDILQQVRASRQTGMAGKDPYIISNIDLNVAALSFLRIENYLFVPDQCAQS